MLPKNPENCKLNTGKLRRQPDVRRFAKHRLNDTIMIMNCPVGNLVLANCNISNKMKQIVLDISVTPPTIQAIDTWSCVVIINSQIHITVGKGG